MDITIKKIIRAILPLLLIVLLQSASYKGQSSGDYQRGNIHKYALIIGVDGYPKFEPSAQLKYGSNDAEAFKKFLQTPNGGSFPEANIKLLVKDKATRENIFKAIDSFKSKIPNDLMYVFFSGHGLAKERTLYLMPYDGDPSKPPIVSGIKIEDFMQQIISNVDAKKTIFFIDACHSGLAVKAIEGSKEPAKGITIDEIFDKVLKEQLEREDEEDTGAMGFFSSASGQQSWEDKGFQHGLFTYYLIEGMKGGANANHDSFVDAEELSKYVRDKVEEFSRQKYKRQTPRVSGNLKSDFPLAYCGVTPPSIGENVVGRFVKIAAGEFIMGSINGDKDEQRVHKVVMSKAFEMGAYEVTQKQWEAVTGTNRSYFKGADLPVETVSWAEVQEFISQLNSKSTRYNYRLPTEAEWEYACRAGSKGEYAGDLNEMGWYGNNSGDSRIDASEIFKTDLENYGNRVLGNKCRTHPVGQKQPNAWGLYDMHGNVWEWCSDWYGEYSSGTMIDPRGASLGSIRVYRGGSWGSTAYNCRSALRGDDAPDYRGSHVGFRLVRTSR